MRINHTSYAGQFRLKDEKFIKQILNFREHGMGYSLVDVTLKDGTIVLQVPICNGVVVCFYDSMRQFSETEIANVAASQV